MYFLHSQWVAIDLLLGHSNEGAARVVAIVSNPEPIVQYTELTEAR